MAFESLKGSLKDKGKAGRWFSPLRIHVLPALGSKPIEDIHQRDIEKALKPIWKVKPAAANKAIQRLGLVLKHGAAMGLDVNINAVANARQLLGAHQVFNQTEPPQHLHFAISILLNVETMALGADSGVFKRLCPSCGQS